MSRIKEVALHLNKVPNTMKLALKKIAKEENRSLEKQVVQIFKEYLERR